MLLVKKCFLIAAVLIVALFVSAVADAFETSTERNKSGAYPEMAKSEFWIARTPNAAKLVMQSGEITSFSENITKKEGTFCQDVLTYPEIISKDVLLKNIAAYSFPKGKRYNGNKLVSAEYYVQLAKKLNLDEIQELNIAKYGYIVKNTALRAFPTDDVSYTDPGDTEFDMNMESTVKIWDEVLILHASTDKNWLFVITKNCSGWAKAAHVAVADRKTLAAYRKKPFVVITGNRVIPDVNHLAPQNGRPELMMGTQLPLTEGAAVIDGVSTEYAYVVSLPMRNEDGTFSETAIRLPFNADISIGYLPYTKENVIKQAFKVLGERYGWGGMWNARDCSSFIADVYQTFGILLPRNSSAQAKAGSVTYDTSEMIDGEKLVLLQQQPAGTIIYFRGHVMMYLGSVRGVPYVIHDSYSYGESGKGGSDGRMTVNCVVVSDLNVTRKDGSTFLSNIKTLVQIK